MAARGSILNGKMSAATIQYVDSTADVKLVYDTKNKLITNDVTPIEAQSFQFTKVIAGAITFSESLLFDIGRDLVDTQTITEALAITMRIVLAESTPGFSEELIATTNGSREIGGFMFGVGPMG
tara:strand:- start:256 stop:627 length:372 start_codon:yes stop_codon:yes gene_type:complete